MRCDAIKTSGEQCNGRARPGRAWCFSHDPELQGRAEEARKAGGHNSSNVERAAKRLPKSLRDVQAILLELIRDVHGAENIPLQDKAAGVSRLAGAYVRVHEAGEVKLELEEVKAMLDRQGAQQWRA